MSNSSKKICIMSRALSYPVLRHPEDTIKTIEIICIWLYVEMSYPRDSLYRNATHTYDNKANKKETKIGIHLKLHIGEKETGAITKTDLSHHEHSQWPNFIT